MTEGFEHFSGGLDSLETQLQAAVSVSERLRGTRSESWSGIWGSILHTRVILNASSLVKIIEAATTRPPGSQLLDHFSVASIARTAMEAGVMALYVTDPRADPDDTEMRRKVFLLHDTCHRTRMFKPGEKQKAEVRAMREMYRRKIAELKAELEAMPKFIALPEEARMRILSGRDFYVGGVRGALALIGWEKHEYEFFEAYFSGYVHSMPVSFLRVDEHEIDFATISDFQYALCGTATWAVADTLARTTARMRSLLSDPSSSAINI